MTEFLRDCNMVMCFIICTKMRVCSPSQTYFTAETSFFSDLPIKNNNLGAVGIVIAYIS